MRLALGRNGIPSPLRAKRQLKQKIPGALWLPAHPVTHLPTFLNQGRQAGEATPPPLTVTLLLLWRWGVVFGGRVTLVLHHSLEQECPRGNSHGLSVLPSSTSSLLCFFLHSPKHQSCEDRKMNYAGFQHPRSLSAWILGNSSWSGNRGGFCQNNDTFI